MHNAPYLSPLKTKKNQLFKKINSKRLQKEVAWIVIGQAGTAIAGILGIKLLTNVLGPADFGKLSLANTIVALISLLILANCPLQIQ